MADRNVALTRKSDEDRRQARWVVARDLAAFQFKLMLDGLKDIALAPISIVAAVAGIVVGSGHPGRYLRAVMRLGRNFDRWVNLYGTEDGTRAGLDEHIGTVEDAIKRNGARPGLTATARSAVDRTLDIVDPPRPEPVVDQSRRD